MSPQQNLSEVIVVMDLDAPTEAARHIDAIACVQQSASPRVRIVACDPGRSAEIRGINGVAVAAEGSVPDDVIEQLTGIDALFVRAWNVRQRDPHKHRPGEGLNWGGTADFKPPDIIDS